MFKKTNNQKIKTVLMYQMWYLLPSFAVMAGILIVFMILSTTAGIINTSYDMAVAIFLLVIGLLVQGILFRYCLYNGTSRRTYFIASMIAVFVFSTLVGLFAATAITIDGGSSIFEMVYTPQSFFAKFAWVTLLSAMCMIIGWFMKVVFDALSRFWRFFAIGALFAVVVILILINFFAVPDMFWRVTGAILGLRLYSPTPYFALMWFSVLSFGFGTATWLILRRVQVN